MSIAETPEIKYKYIDQCIRGMPLVFLTPLGNSRAAFCCI